MRARSKFAFIASLSLFLYGMCVHVLESKKKFNSNVLKQLPQNKATEPNAVQAPTLETRKQVTKSLSQLGKMDEVSKTIVFLNSIPNSGSEILSLLLKWLQGWNNFKHVKLNNGSQKKQLTSVETEEFVSSTCDIIRNEAVPISFDRMIFFVNFTFYDRQSPTFINLIRDPADYVLSRFHQIMENIPMLKTSKDIEKCIVEKRTGCIFNNGRPYELMIPYFCGQKLFCQELNSDKALNVAKETVEKYYATLGIAEELNATLVMLEHQLPYFFKGASSLFYRKLMPILQQHGALKATKTFKKQMRSILQKEYEFYEWAKSRLFQQMRLISSH